MIPSSVPESTDLTAAEVAVLLRCSERTVLRHVAEGRLAGRRVGLKKIVISRDAVAVFLRGVPVVAPLGLGQLMA